MVSGLHSCDMNLQPLDEIGAAQSRWSILRYFPIFVVIPRWFFGRGFMVWSWILQSIPEADTSQPFQKLGWSLNGDKWSLYCLFTFNCPTCLSYLYLYVIHIDYIDQRTTLSSWFSPSTFMGDLGIELSLSGFHKEFTHCSISHLTDTFYML